VSREALAAGEARSTSTLVGCSHATRSFRVDYSWEFSSGGSGLHSGPLTTRSFRWPLPGLTTMLMANRTQGCAGVIAGWPWA